MIRQKAFAAIEGKSPAKLPLLLSAPHVGLVIPEDFKREISEEFHDFQPDADHLVHRLYQPLCALGCDLVHAIFSRYVIDLNRSLDQKPLYEDAARQQTGLIPETTFAGQPIYPNKLSPDHLTARLPYYESYHAELSKRLKELRKDFKEVLLIDAHSIPREVPAIRKEPFTDIIVGDNSGKSCSEKISGIVIEEFKNAGFTVSYNDPFQGGFITRHYGKPSDGIHAIQLEISQDIYLKSPFRIDASKSERYREALKKALERIFPK